jgi:hypothetical protein
LLAAQEVRVIGQVLMQRGWQLDLNLYGFIVREGT